MKKCRKCTSEKPIVEFQKDSRRKDGHTTLCKSCAADYSNQWHRDNRDRHNKYLRKRWYKQKAKFPNKHLWWLAKRRSREDGVKFTIKPSDILVPEICPAFKKKLGFKKGSYSPWAPSLDRIIPKLGYVPGNIVVISHKANTMKSNATLSELRELAAWMETLSI